MILYRVLIEREVVGGRDWSVYVLFMGIRIAERQLRDKGKMSVGEVGMNSRRRGNCGWECRNDEREAVGKRITPIQTFLRQGGRVKKGGAQFQFRS